MNDDWVFNKVNVMMWIGVCHTLILDLKILLQNSFLFLILFYSLCFTLQFSTVLQLHILLFLSLIFLHVRPS